MIRKNTRAALYLLLLGGREMTKIKHMKLLFLATRTNHIYDFVPYYYGPYSFELYNDFRTLIRDGIITEEGNKQEEGASTESWCLKEDWVVPKPDPGIQRVLNAVYNEYGSLSDDKLIQYVYDNYPEYSVNSKITKYKHVQDFPHETGIVTIGYEGKNFDQFVYQLIENNVDLLVDVRSNAYSMKYGFSKYSLERIFSSFQKDSFTKKIKYKHIPELGIPSETRKQTPVSKYGDMFRDYEQDLDNKMQYVEELIDLSKTHKIALMCFEADVSCCHRGIIAKRLREMGCFVEDI